MKILVGCLYHETNTFNPIPTNLDDFIVYKGEDCLKRLASTDVFLENNIDLVPTFYATALPSGVVTQNAFEYFCKEVNSTIKREKDIDGIWFHLHGAMYVEKIGSADLAFLKNIRAAIGVNVPISLTMDIHANNSEEIKDFCNIVCSYKTIPHVDQSDIERKTANLLLDIIMKKDLVKPILIKLPYIICGEKALGNQEPMKSIFLKIKELEERKSVLTVSFFLGHAWSDSISTSASIVVIPKTNKHFDHAREIAMELEDFINTRINEFKYSSKSLDPRSTVLISLQDKKRIVFISDTGDNTTAGATGMNTVLMKLLLENNTIKKKVLIAAIYDKKSYFLLKDYKIGELVEFSLGTNIDEYSKPVQITGKIKSKGDLLGYLNAEDDKVGDVCTVSVTNIDIVVANRPESFITLNHFKRAGVSIEDYDLIVVKQGYLFEELSKIADNHYFALTPGATLLDLNYLNYKNKKQGIRLV
jgi:microcystin degradation protein MlrC